MSAEKIKELRGLVAMLDVPLRVSPGWLRSNSGNKIAGVGEGEMSIPDASDIAIAVNSLPALLDEVEALRADAERYRWLRDRKRLVDGAEDGGLYVGIESADLWGLAGEDADAAIDAARHEPKDAER